MSSIASIRLAFRQELSKAIKPRIDEAGRELEKVIYDLIWKRTAQGIDYQGRTWRRYKAKNYAEKKRAFGRGANDWLVLSGNLKSKMKVKYTGYSQTEQKIIMNFEIVIPADLEPQVKGLLDTTGYDRNRKPYPKSDYQFLGLAEGGETVSDERKFILTVLKKNLEL